VSVTLKKVKDVAISYSSLRF